MSINPSDPPGERELPIARIAILTLLISAGPSTASVPFNDGGTHVLADDSLKNEIIVVSNGTTLEIVDGALLAAGSFVHVYDTSRLEVSGGVIDGGPSGISANDTATVAISGGQFGPIGSGLNVGTVIMRGNSSLTITGGTFGGVEDRAGEIVGQDDATVDIRGGLFGGTGRLSGFVEMRGRNTLTITDGVFGAGGQDSGKINVRVDSTVTVAGGTFDGTGVGASRLSVSGLGTVFKATFVNGARIESLFTGYVSIRGQSFNLPFGPIAVLSGTLTGVFADGTAFTAPFYRGFDQAGPNGVIELNSVCSAAPRIVDTGGPYAADEGGLVTLNGSASGGDVENFAFAWDLDGDGMFETSGATVDLDAIALDGPSDYAIALQATDEHGCSATAETILTVINVNPSIDSIQATGATVNPIALGDEATMEVAFSDPGLADTHLITWEWGDGTATEVPAGTDPLVGNGSHLYADPGVYRVTTTVTDDDDGFDVSIYEFVVIYDPAGGFVTGGGHVHSPEGAYPFDPDLTGKANFGFVSKYKKGATVPTGETEFHFSTAGLHFHSSSYDWLVIAGAKALYKGWGSVNGYDGYRFLLSAIDGAIHGDGTDTFRIKIWDVETEEVVYDNALGAADDVDSPTAITGGNIVIHSDEGGTETK